MIKFLLMSTNNALFTEAKSKVTKSTNDCLILMQHKHITIHSEEPVRFH